MSCLEMPRSPAPDFLGEKGRTFNDAETMQPRAPVALPSPDWSDVGSSRVP